MFAPKEKRSFFSGKVSLTLGLLLTLAFCLSHAGTDRVLKPEEMNEDLEFLCENLIDIHPNVYANFPKEEFEAAKQRLLEKFRQPMRINDFYYHLVEFVARVSDDHTCLSASGQIEESSECLPLYAKWFGDELRIIEAAGPHKGVLKGAKVVSLGGMYPHQLMNKLRNYCFTETDYWMKEYYTNELLKKSLLNRISSRDWADSVPITVMPDELSQETEIQLALVTCDQCPEVELPITPYFEYSYLEDVAAVHFIFRRFFDDQVARNLGKERASQYGLVESGDFKDFLRDMFRAVREQEVEYIIIDLRQNTGGNSILGFQFLRHIDTGEKEIKEFTCQEKLSRFVTREYRMTPWQRFKAKYLGSWPKNIGGLTPLREEGLNNALDNKDSEFYMPPIDPSLRFQGKLICLTSNRTFSSAMEFAVLLSDNGLAVLVGEPTGGKPESFGDIVSRRLPHSSFRLGVSWKVFHRPDSTKQDEISLFPDHEVITTYEDFKTGIDPVMEYTKKYISLDRFKAGR